MYAAAGAAEPGPESPFLQLLFPLERSSLALTITDPSSAHLVHRAYAGFKAVGGRAATHAGAMVRSGGRLSLRFDRHELRVAENASKGEPMLGAFYGAREIFARFAAAQPGALALYGTLVDIGGKAVLLLGPSGSGKTLLAMHLASQGARLLGDETVLLDMRCGMVCAIPRRASLRESALDHLPDTLRARVECDPDCVATNRGRLWYALSPQTIGGGEPSARTYPLHAVCVLSGRADSTIIEPIELGRAAPAIGARAYARPARLSEAGALRRALRGVCCYNVMLGAPAQSAAMLAQTCA